MGKKIIGRRTVVKIGGEPPEEDDAIVGTDTTVYVPRAKMWESTIALPEKW